MLATLYGNNNFSIGYNIFVNDIDPNECYDHWLLTTAVISFECLSSNCCFLFSFQHGIFFFFFCFCISITLLSAESLLAIDWYQYYYTFFKASIIHSAWYVDRTPPKNSWFLVKNHKHILPIFFCKLL